MRRLVAAGADPSWDGSTSTDALYRAIELESVEMVEELVRLGGARSASYDAIVDHADHPRIREIMTAVIEHPEQ